jgi:hypothetical protein
MDVSASTRRPLSSLCSGQPTPRLYERVVEALRSRYYRRRAEGLTSTRFARFVGLDFATHPRKLLQERLRRTRQQYEEDLEAGARQAPRPARGPGVSERGAMGKAGGLLREPVIPEAAQEAPAGRTAKPTTTPARGRVRRADNDDPHACTESGGATAEPDAEARGQGGRLFKP